MNGSEAITVHTMAELTSQLNLLILAFIGGSITIIGVVVAVLRWYIPRRFEQQTAEREARIEALKVEFETKAAAEKVDIERDKMLPRLIEATIQMSQSFNTTMLQSTQQTAAYSQQLSAHDRQLTSNTEQLMKLADIMDQGMATIQALKHTVDLNTDQTKTAAVYSERAAKVAEDTLEFVKSKIIQVVEKSKHDTGPIPKLEDVSKPDEPPALKEAC